MDIRLPAVGRDAIESPELGSSSDEEEDIDMADAQARRPVLCYCSQIEHWWRRWKKRNAN